jgi:hypothetical protein
MNLCNWVLLGVRLVMSREALAQAFLKKLAMLPCPFFAAGFPFALLDGFDGAGLSFLSCGSSSEKDSQTASSLVTEHV